MSDALIYMLVTGVVLIALSQDNKQASSSQQVRNQEQWILIGK
tara:strand:- start:1106 stop:1234 length:129 start_codon:yes stop_codon:yes gene_type:complete